KAKHKAFNIVGIILQIASLGLLIAGIFVTLYLMIGFALMFMLGVLLVQYYYTLTVEYNYHMSENSIVFSKKDVRLRSKTLLTLPFDKILAFERFGDAVDTGDYVFLDNPSRSDAYILVFVTKPQSRVIFAPDTYLKALICDRLGLEMEAEE
ncbi:MAG: hypothetical protein GX891_03620, partial [Clostridiales bacterium]|nr:hypothetical protein [Clostridiales bacterium]